MASGISGTAIVVGQSDELETGSARHVFSLPLKRGNNSLRNTDALVSLKGSFLPPPPVPQSRPSPPTTGIQSLFNLPADYSPFLHGEPASRRARSLFNGAKQERRGRAPDGPPAKLPALTCLLTRSPFPAVADASPGAAAERALGRRKTSRYTCR